jgi:lysophospholipase L1-like esterase
MAAWATAHPEYAQVSVLWSVGGGFLGSGTVTTFDTSAFDAHSKHMIEVEMPDSIDALHPDVVMLMNSVNDVSDRRWSDAEGSIAPMNPLYRQRLFDAYRDTTQSILDRGVAHVVWVVPPIPDVPWERVEMQDPARYQAQHDVIEEVADSFPAGVSTLDLDTYSTATALDHDPQWRPDGLHFSAAAAGDLATTYIGPSLVETALE